jgi:lysophospholipase L1-like esterase
MMGALSIVAGFVIAAALNTPMQTTVRIIALGDSTTAGTPGWKSRLEAPPDGAGNEQSQYAYWLRRSHPDWTVINQGVNGERSDQILARFDRDVVDERPNLVVIIAGVNDVYQGRSVDHVTRQLTAMYDRARAAGIPVVAGTIIPYNTATAEQNARMRVINEWIRGRAAADPNVDFVDTRAAAAAPADPDRLFDSPDDLHPSPAGYRRMADAIGPVLEAVLEKHQVR